MLRIYAKVGAHHLTSVTDSFILPDPPSETIRHIRGEKGPANEFRLNNNICRLRGSRNTDGVGSRIWHSNSFLKTPEVHVWRHVIDVFGRVTRRQADEWFICAEGSPAALPCARSNR